MQRGVSESDPNILQAALPGPIPAFLGILTEPNLLQLVKIETRRE